MELSEELLYSELGKCVADYVRGLNVDYKEICEIKAVALLYEIVALMENEEICDFLLIDELVELLYRNGISVEGRRDF